MPAPGRSREAATTAAERRRLTREGLAAVLQAESLDGLDAAEIVALFRGETQMAPYLPDGVYQVDPRDGAVIVYNSARSRRPHDYDPGAASAAPDGSACPICDGNTTGVIDVAPLSKGFTFINKNLFPILSPPDGGLAVPPAGGNGAAGDRGVAGGIAGHGLHLLQWTSSYHDRDWHNMPAEDLAVVLGRLAALETKLLFGDAGIVPDAAGGAARGHVSIIKNHGRLVGGSLSHGHQQIAYSDVKPSRFAENERFAERHGEVFTAFLQRENPSSLRVRDYGPVELVVPYFMRRPYDMILVVKDVRRCYLGDLGAEELAAVATAWGDASRAIIDIMPRVGRDPAYNATVNSGPGAGLYVAFHPYTQETGGFEHLGLWACQSSPEIAAAQLREVFEEAGAR